MIQEACEIKEQLLRQYDEAREKHAAAMADLYRVIGGTVAIEEHQRLNRAVGEACRFSEDASEQLRLHTAAHHC